MTLSRHEKSRANGRHRFTMEMDDKDRASLLFVTEALRAGSYTEAILRSLRAMEKILKAEVANESIELDKLTG